MANTSVPPTEMLVDVVIETFLGARYQIPDMTKSAIERMLKDNIAFQGDLILSNVSHATLVIPTRIIKTITVDGEMKWSGIDPLHELRKPSL